MEQNVVDLGVVMGHPQRQLTGLLHIGELAGQILNTQHPLQFLPDFLQAAGGIGFHRGHQLGITVPGVVEIGDGLRQQADLKVRQIRLEVTKGFARVTDDQKIGADAVSNGGHIVGHSPEVVFVDQVGLAVIGVMEVQSGLSGLLGADVLRHQVDILHQTHRIPEGIGIDILHQERLGLTVGQQEVDLVGLVHVTHLNGFISQIFVFNFKQSADLQQFIM